MERKSTRIQDVKQHIYRQSAKSPFYCPNCYKEFQSPGRWDDHIRKSSCLTASPRPDSDMISPQAVDSLKRWPDQNLGSIEQWCKIWNTLFPNEEVPPSVHLHGKISEMVDLVRFFWKIEGHLVINRLESIHPVSVADIQVLIMRVFDEAQRYLEGEPSWAEDAIGAGSGQSGTYSMENFLINSEQHMPFGNSLEHYGWDNFSFSSGMAAGVAVEPIDENFVDINSMMSL